MAITIIDKPFDFTPVGQKLLYALSSNNTTQNGFKLKVEVEDMTTGEVYEYFIPKNPYGYFVFDLNPLVDLRNNELTPEYHKNGLMFNLTGGNGWNQYDIDFSEWWIVSGVLTRNVSANTGVSTIVFNATTQISDGYKPNPDSDSLDTVSTNYVMHDGNSRIMSVRNQSTHVWHYADTFLPSNITENAIYIPTFLTDAGIFQFPYNDYWSLQTATEFTVVVFGTSGTIDGGTLSLSGAPIIGIPAYPLNLAQAEYGGIPIPAAYDSTWTCYVVTLSDGSNDSSIPYVFYNAKKYGQSDCRFDYVRVGWVNSRGGWDYFNFIKKNEVNWDIERKQYTRILQNSDNYGFSGGASPFRKNERQLTDRKAIAKNFLSINSDWIQEGEYLLLRDMLLSTEVSIISTDGISIPVSVVDTAWTERKERNGKLYNVTIKLRYSQQYWTI